MQVWQFDACAMQRVVFSLLITWNFKHWGWTHSITPCGDSFGASWSIYSGKKLRIWRTVSPVQRVQ